MVDNVIEMVNLARAKNQLPQQLLHSRIKTAATTIIKPALTNKKAIFRTLEALIAIFITLLFLLMFIPQVRERSEPQTPQNVLASLRDNDDFRNCAIQKNQTCLTQFAERNLEGKYEFKINVSDNPNAIVPGLPGKRVYANSLFISGNTTNSTLTIVRLYFSTK